MKLTTKTEKPKIYLHFSYEEAVILRIFFGKLSLTKVTAIIGEDDVPAHPKFPEAAYTLTDEIYQVLQKGGV